jgi:hypothetical protein
MGTDYYIIMGRVLGVLKRFFSSNGYYVSLFLSCVTLRIEMWVVVVVMRSMLSSRCNRAFDPLAIFRAVIDDDASKVVVCLPLREYVCFTCLECQQLCGLVRYVHRRNTLSRIKSKSSLADQPTDRSIHPSIDHQKYLSQHRMQDHMQKSKNPDFTLEPHNQAHRTR